MSSKKIRDFLDKNFPPCASFKILEEESDTAVVLLDYGRYEDKLKIKLKKCAEDGNLYKLEETQFI